MNISYSKWFQFNQFQSYSTMIVMLKMNYNLTAEISLDEIFLAIEGGWIIL